MWLSGNDVKSSFFPSVFLFVIKPKRCIGKGKKTRLVVINKLKKAFRPGGNVTFVLMENR